MKRPLGKLALILPLALGAVALAEEGSPALEQNGRVAPGTGQAPADARQDPAQASHPTNGAETATGEVKPEATPGSEAREAREAAAARRDEAEARKEREEVQRERREARREAREERRERHHAR